MCRQLYTLQLMNVKKKITAHFGQVYLRRNVLVELTFLCVCGTACLTWNYRNTGFLKTNYISIPFPHF